MKIMRKQQKVPLDTRLADFGDRFARLFHITALIAVGWHSLKVPGLTNKIAVLESVSQGHEATINNHKSRLEVNTWHVNVVEHDLNALKERVSFLEQKSPIHGKKHKGK